jgi:uncharacterized membrane protein
MKISFSHRLTVVFALLLAMYASTSPVRAQTPTPEAPVVHAVMFWKVGCHFCEQTISIILPPIQEKYGAQFDLLLIRLITKKDIENFIRLADSYGIPKGGSGVPFLIIGDHVMMGPPTINDQLPELIDFYLAQGGVELPQNEILTEIIANLPPSSTPGVYIYPPPETPVETAPVTPLLSEEKSNGFTLAIGVMLGIALALAYTLVAILWPRLPVPTGRWLDAVVIVLIVIGLAVAGYLSYIEVKSARAICGPVGDCNTVQSSPYARLFGILPIGVLGMVGYVLLLAALAVRRFVPRLRFWAALSFFGMAFFGTAFSFYLTYLERFVIQAVCLWCIASAVIMTLLLLSSIAPLREAQIHKRKESENV